MHSIIAGTGSYIPKKKIPNENFYSHEFYTAQGEKFHKAIKETVAKFEEITNIHERRYVTDELVTSDIAFLAALDALESSGIDKETLDYIIVAHNFGDVPADNRRSDILPSLAARVKHKLKIKNPKTIPYDLPFGCPGWLQGMIQADYFLKSGDAKKALVIGAETLSRITDPHDMDCMLFSDGAGATIIESVSSSEPVGILSHCTRSDTLEHAYMLWMDKSYNPDYCGNERFLKMHGHKLYQYALKTVPLVVKESIDKAGLTLKDISKVLIHQANEKMDEAILKRLFRLYGERNMPEGIMPMTISRLGNSSVATVPTLLDLLLKGKLAAHDCREGDILVFTSVGAGMNINSVIYKI
jgi:3-oxoacyl-[acyl-carrier-protein] synthase III